MERKYDVVILYSGGSDSRLLLSMALNQKRKPLLVHVRYGQHGTHHDHKSNLFHLGVDYREVTVNGVMYNYKMEYVNVPKDYLPYRNTILIGLAAAIAKQEGVYEIWYGANKTDELDGYPDCQPRWINAMNEVLEAEMVFLNAPLQGYTQEEVVAKIDDYADK